MKVNDLDLYRFLVAADYPNGCLRQGEPLPDLIKPDYYSRVLEDGSTRPADVDTFKDRNGVEWVRKGTGGVSLFDSSRALKSRRWLPFEIPQGTVVPESLSIHKGKYNEKLQSTHYQIRGHLDLITRESFQGALDNLARNAVKRSIELASSKR